MRIRIAIATFVLAVAVVATAQADSPLAPKKHADFGHYTLALTWQPGFCAEGQCAADQNHDVRLGLHGLWASRPQDLISRGVAARQWWSRGCDFYHHSDAAPQLDRATRRHLERVMPQLDRSLLTHEYDKHVQCFDFDTQRFFATELGLRQRIADSPLGDWLRQHAGQRVARANLRAEFDRAFDTSKTQALQLRCSGPYDSRYLSQLWLTIPRAHLAEFPQDAGLMQAPIAQHNCPAHFRVPAWPSE
ncbi:ribonuclease I [Salinisphaera sp. LB1]|uniref:ribonuclease T2 family protein n=1 Tax=Salinisphaera sp. LB1 TaxID=2183911 RepID=UPI000D705DDF|nr:ribonuclease I [Salinisphaera sp. LB1]AWN17265.1 Ribonuclease I precursor [Salinisphaera sp. LB1]